MRDEGFRLKVHAPRRAGASIGGCCHIDGTRGVVAADRKLADQAAVEVKVCSEAATAMSACAKGGGKVFPRFSARRRIPRQAVPLKKYRSGNSPVSKMSDNEDAAPSLRYSEKLSVKNPVGDPIPELDQQPEEGSKRPSSVNRQDTGDVLPYQP
jgi:hypothetical protein